MSGVTGFTSEAAQELGPYGIRVHAVESGEGIVVRILSLLEEER